MSYKALYISFAVSSLGSSLRATNWRRHPTQSAFANRTRSNLACLRRLVIVDRDRGRRTPGYGRVSRTRLFGAHPLFVGIRWLSRTAEDLMHLHACIAQDNPEAATSKTEKIAIRRVTAPQPHAVYANRGP